MTEQDAFSSQSEIRYLAFVSQRNTKIFAVFLSKNFLDFPTGSGANR
jgi:hypothetical protein